MPEKIPEMISGNDKSSYAEGKKPKDERRSIFRERAMRYYLEGREKEVLPQFISPRSFLLLWVLFGLVLVAAAGAAYSMKTPAYASGPAVVIDRDGQGPSVAAFLPPEQLGDLQEGQKLLLQLDPEGEGLVRSVASVEPEVMSPEAARNQFDLEGGQEAAVTQPAAVATAPLEPLPDATDASEHDGGIYRADVEVGSRRAISLFPVVGDLIEDGR